MATTRWLRGRNRPIRAVSVVVAGSVAAVLLAACGSGYSGGGNSTSAVDSDSGSRSSAGSYNGEKLDAAAPEAAPAPVPGTVGAPQQAQQAPDQPITPAGRSLIRTAQLGVEVDDVTVAHGKVRTAVAAAGGYIAEEQTYLTSASMVLRVPATALDKLTDDVSSFGTATSRSTQVSDVTEKVVDLDARVATQQASVARVRALLAQATSIGDVVSIESELARREADLDSLTGRLAALQGQVELSTLSIDMRQKNGPVVDGVPGPTGFLAGIDAGWRGLVALGTFLGAVVGFLLPMIPVLLVLGGIVWFVRRTVKARTVPAPAGAAAAGAGRSGPGSEGES